jgi:basic membrane lipoprotein Med (substrate-binding protein (PBP1-ABC) superfamily)
MLKKSLLLFLMILSTLFIYSCAEQEDVSSLTKKIDSLIEKVNDLTKRVEELEEKVATLTAKEVAKKLKVGLVFDIGGRGDQSFNDSAYRGLEWASKLGISHVEIEPGADADRETGLRMPRLGDWCRFSFYRCDQGDCRRISRYKIRHHRRLCSRQTQCVIHAFYRA